MLSKYIVLLYFILFALNLSCNREVLPDPIRNKDGAINDTSKNISNFLSVSTTIPTVPANGSSYQIKVLSNINWAISSFPSWLSLDKTSGNGDAISNIIVQSNTGAARSGKIIIGGSGVTSVEVTVSQLSGIIIPPVETTYYQPFDVLGNVIMNKKLSSNSDISAAPLAFHATNVDIENCEIIGNFTSPFDLIQISDGSQPYSVKFINNVVSFKHPNPHILEIGSEGTTGYDNRYDGAEITGNSFTGIGDMSSGQNHGVFVGFNTGGKIKYNFITNCPDAIVLKSQYDDNSNGIISYNLIKNATFGVIAKGITNTHIYNNTFYNDAVNTVNYASFIELLKNKDGGNGSYGTVIKNNIFYSSGIQWIMIAVEDPESFVNLKCDYNIYYRDGSNHDIAFYVKDNQGDHYYNFSQWQSLGFDIHSKILDPKLNSTTLEPASMLNNAENLGAGFSVGIDASNTWKRTNVITKSQGSLWQNGAILK